MTNCVDDIVLTTIQLMDVADQLEEMQLNDFSESKLHTEAEKIREFCCYIQDSCIQLSLQQTEEHKKPND